MRSGEKRERGIRGKKTRKTRKDTFFSVFRVFPFVPLFLFLAFCCLSDRAEAQTTLSTAGTGTISGRVMSNDKPLAGIVLVLRPSLSSDGRTIARVVTDADGRYQFMGIAAGSYAVVPLAKSYYWGNAETFVVWKAEATETYVGSLANRVSLNEGGTVAGVDLNLRRGGVITGKVTDANGRPVVEEFVNFELAETEDRSTANNSSLGTGEMMTDDRGVYRIYGLAPGRYRISSGNPGFFGSGKGYPLTFHPDSPHQARAQVIEVAEGSETSGVDIRLGARDQTFAVIGRAVNAETGEGEANIEVHAIMFSSDGAPIGRNHGPPTGPNGEFRLEGLLSGRYVIFAGTNEYFREVPDDFSGSLGVGYSDPVEVEVRAGDVKDLELKIRRGGSISGIAVLEGAGAPATPAILGYVRLRAELDEGDAPLGAPFVYEARLGPDRKVQFDALRPGKYTIHAVPVQTKEASLNLLRVERDGIAQPYGIEVRPGEQVRGVSPVFVYGNGIVRGQINVVNGNLPVGSSVSVNIRHVSIGDHGLQKTVKMDSSRDFVIQGLAPGEYVIEARIFFRLPPPGFREPQRIRQSVVVANGQVQQVTLTFDFGR